MFHEGQVTDPLTLKPVNRQADVVRKGTTRRSHRGVPWRSYREKGS